MGLPPGPSIRLIQTMHVLRDPYAYYQRIVAKYGDPFTIPAINGTIVGTGRPELVKTIYAADPNIYLPFAPDVIESIAGPRAIFSLVRDEHRRERKLLMPPFHGDRMRTYGSTMIATAEEHAKRWESGKPFSAMEWAQGVTLDIIIKTIFGVTGGNKFQETRDAVLEVTRSIHPLGVFTKFFRREFGGFGPYARMVRARKHLDSLLKQEIAHRRGKEDFGQDILSLMIDARYDDGSQMTEDAICDELRGLLFAGHETTTIAIAWAFYWLHQNPQSLAKLREELDALDPETDPEAIARLPYLDAVCNETLRLYPIVQESMRVLAGPFEFAGYTLQPGITVAAISALVHYREDLYPEPHTFRPERFLERKFGSNEYMPFGGGHRRCIGAAFAGFEMRLILATILRSRSLRLESNATIGAVRRNVTMGPEGGVSMIFEGTRELPLAVGVV